MRTVCCLYRVEFFIAEQATRPVKEYLDALDKENIRGDIPKKVSPTDPQARFTAAAKQLAFFTYIT